MHRLNLISWVALFSCVPMLSAFGQDDGLAHARIIEGWNDESLVRGETLYQSACAQCHGPDGNSPPHPSARAFGKDTFKFGSDPYSMYRTLTYGAGAMLAQTWLAPAERYDVIHYIRETMIKPTNEAAYTDLSKSYLRGLPKGDSMGKRR